MGSSTGLIPLADHSIESPTAGEENMNHLPHGVVSRGQAADFFHRNVRYRLWSLESHEESRETLPADSLRDRSYFDRLSDPLGFLCGYMFDTNQNITQSFLASSAPSDPFDPESQMVPSHLSLSSSLGGVNQQARRPRYISAPTFMDYLTVMRYLRRHPSYPDGVFNQRAPSLHGNIAGDLNSVSSEDAENLFLNSARLEGNIPGDLSSVNSEVAENLSLNSARVEGNIAGDLSSVSSEDAENLSLNSASAEERPRPDQPGFKEALLAISAQAGLAMVTTSNSANTSLSQNKKIQSHLAAVFNVIGFFVLLFAILLRNRRNTTLARKLTAMGIALTAFGYLAMMGMLLNDNIMLWVTGLACLVCFPALAFAFNQLD